MLLLLELPCEQREGWTTTMTIPGCHQGNCLGTTKRTSCVVRNNSLEQQHQHIHLCSGAARGPAPAAAASHHLCEYLLGGIIGCCGWVDIKVFRPPLRRHKPTHLYRCVWRQNPWDHISLSRPSVRPSKWALEHLDISHTEQAEPRGIRIN